MARWGRPCAADSLLPRGALARSEGPFGLAKSDELALESCLSICAVTAGGVAMVKHTASGECC